MGRFTPPPPTVEPPYVQVEGSATLLGLGTEEAPTELRPGAQTFLKAEPNVGNGRLTVSSIGDAPPTALSHFHAGPLPSDGSLVRRFGVGHRVVQSGRLAAVEAHLATPQTDVASGHYGLRISGSDFGFTDLDFNVDGQARYALDLQAAEQIGTSSSGSSFITNNGICGWAQLFEATGDATIYAVSNGVNINGDASGKLVRIGVLDLNGEWLSYRDVAQSTLQTGTPDSRAVLLPDPVDVSNGELVYIGMEPVGGWETGVGAVCGMNDRATAVSGTLFTTGSRVLDDDGTPKLTYGLSYSRTDVPEGTSLWDCFNGSARTFVSTHGGSGYGPSTGVSGCPPMTVYGRTDGLDIGGDLVDVTSRVTSTPTVTPEDVNFLLHIL